MPDGSPSGRIRQPGPAVPVSSPPVPCMISLRRATRLSTAIVFAAALPATLPAQQRLTSPKEFFGHDIGADYELPNYTRLHAYFVKLANESDRVVLDTIGLTEEGRPQIMAIVTSAENHKNLARYQEIARKLALAEGIDSLEAKRLAKEGKVIFWIDGGLHATEVLGAQQLMESLWQLTSRTDEETQRILNDCIILMVHANPDGMELVSDWYMKESDKLRRTTGTIPRLYEKYAGHDNNRDSYMNALKETTNISRAMFIEWHPQIMYNHHQTGPTGTVMAAPPYRDPANYWFHPAMITGLDLVGAALNHRFVTENKPGLTFRAGSNYSTWWNGGLRTVAYYHNIIGILTETIGNPTPMRVSLVPDRQMRSAGLPLPIEPQVWRFRQSIDYSVTANYAFLDLASRYRERFLFDRWRMGMDQIEKGKKDTWTVSPKRYAELMDSIAKDRSASTEAGRAGGPRGGGAASPGSAVVNDRYMSVLKKPANRDPRGYIMSSAQNDFPTATKFVQALQKSGVQVHRATSSFSTNGKSYPAGSWVIQTAQAFRSHALDMFEPQDHPNDFRYPGGPPIPPYDNAGWTLAFQMGIQFDRALNAISGPFELVKDVTMMPTGIVAKGKAGYFIHPDVNDAATVANRLAQSKIKASRSPVAFTDGNTKWPAGTWFVPAGGAADAVVAKAGKDLGVNFAAANSKPSGLQPVQPLRIGLVDRYGGNMPSGWTRLILEKFEFGYSSVYPMEVDAGNLKAKYDVLVMTDGIFSAQAGPGAGFGGSPDTTLIPPEYRKQLGRLSAEKSAPQLKTFVEAGGRIVAIGSSINVGKAMGLPIENYLTEANGRAYAGEKYYIPGSLLEVKVDTSLTIATGMNPRPSVMFDNSPVMKLGSDAAAKGVRALAVFDSSTPLTSGWAWGQELLKGGVAMAEATMGKGTLWLFGPEILFRSQSHGTYKLFLNALDGGFQRPVKPLQ